jgi:RNA polymerase sigma-70 factor (ECF subfamily)
MTLPLLAARRRLVLERAEAPGTPPDEDLLLRVQQQDEEALLLLFRRYHALVFSIGCRILRDDEGEAEDLVQEVFLHLFSKVRTFDPAKGAGRSWLVQVIYRRAFDRRGWLARRHFYSGTDLENNANALVEEGNLENEVIERLTVQQLRIAFDQLTDRQRETLEMFFFEGLTLAEIAERSGESVQNVRHHYYRGLEHLRQIARNMASGGKSSQ